MEGLIHLLLLLLLLQLLFGCGVKDLFEGIEDGDTIGKDTICQKKSVEEIYGEEAEVRQAFQQPFGSSVADLGHLGAQHGPFIKSIGSLVPFHLVRYFARVEGAAEPDVNVVVEEPRIVAH